MVRGWVGGANVSEVRLAFIPCFKVHFMAALSRNHVAFIAYNQDLRA